MLGHRGLSHPIAFALALSVLAAAIVLPRGDDVRVKVRLWLFLFLASVSHGLLDALTNGGHGVAFFAPFADERYFFPVTPIQVSPIGAAFFSTRGLHVLESEALWVWTPSAAVVALSLLARHRSIRIRDR